MIPPEAVEAWFAKRDRDGWMIHRNNGAMTPIENWRKDLAASKAWAVKTAPSKPNGGPKSYQPRIQENLTLTPYATTAH